MKARFEIVQDAGKFHFVQRADDGALLLTSLSCDSKIMAQNDLLHVRNALRDETRIVEHRADDGTQFVVIKDRDGSPLARSPHVASDAAFAALLLAMRNAAGAPMIDLTKKKPHGAAT